MTDRTRLRVTEYLELDLGDESWHCERCDHRFGPAERNYKEGCLLHERDPREVHEPLLDASSNFAFDPAWTRIVEFYCPGCGTQIETEYLPPGHPITHDIEIDVPALRARLASGESVIRDGLLQPGTQKVTT